MTASPKTVLLLGGGGREHALAWKLAQSPLVGAIHAMPGNDGMAALKKVTCHPGNPADTGTVVAAARALDITLVVIGPEKPLEAGVSDALAEAGFAVIGPSRVAAQLESSKIFAKEFMMEEKIATASFSICSNYGMAQVVLKEWDVEGRGIVIKADGLAAGKGVVVTHKRDEAEKTIHDFMVNPDYIVKSERLLFEHILTGREVSAFALCDGKDFIPLGFVCDYKRVADDDKGPNTGGMGGYAPKGWPSDAARNFVNEKIFRRVVDGMLARGTPFKGILFAGLMVDGDDVNVIEFNTRFGDPETQILLPLLENDLAPLFVKAATGTLAQEKVALKSQTAVHVVMASEGYPETLKGSMKLGQPIDLPEAMLEGVNDNGLLFVSGARKKDGAWTNEGGRVLGVTALGASMEEAREKAYAAIGSIHFNGAHWRKDIGKQPA